MAVPLLSAGSYGGGSFEPLRVGTHGALGTASGGGRGGGGEHGLLVLPLRSVQFCKETRPMLGRAAQVGRPEGELGHSTASGKVQTQTRALTSKGAQTGPGEELYTQAEWFPHCTHLA